MEKTLENFVPKHSFLVCIDSDGCAFDVMEVKHKSAFARQRSMTGIYRQCPDMPGKRGSL